MDNASLSHIWAAHLNELQFELDLVLGQLLELE